jgi:hypothetical protein
MSILCLPLGLVALVFGIVGLVRNRRMSSSWAWSLSIVATFFATIVIALFIFAIANESLQKPPDRKREPGPDSWLRKQR